MSAVKYIELAKKLKALAEQGVGGEAVNAHHMLNSLMVKHGITLDDIEGEIVTERPIKFDGHYTNVLGQVVASVVGPGKFGRFVGTRSKFYAVCTAAEHLEIEAKAAFYLAKLQKEEQRLFTAFCYANNLFPKKDANEEPDYTPLSPEALAELKRAIDMAQGLDKHEFYKQLGQ